jgi:hypothetical protein
MMLNVPENNENLVLVENSHQIIKSTRLMRAVVISGESKSEITNMSLLAFTTHRELSQENPFMLIMLTEKGWMDA